MKRSTSLSIGIVISTALTLLLASAAYSAINKLYTANISSNNPPVTAGQSESFTMTIVNKAPTQQLGSCNVTMNAALTGLAASNPNVGTATVVGRVIQLRNLATPPLGSRSFVFQATAPAAGSYPSTIECRQSNEFNPSTPSNRFTLDAANSNLVITAVSSVPSADLKVETQSVTPQPVVGGNTVTHMLLVTNNGPAASGLTVTLTDTVTGSGAITHIAGGADWTCGGSGGSASCTRGQLSSGASASPVEVRVLASSVSSPSSFTNTASVSQTAQSSDPNTSNNSSASTTTVNPGNTGGTGWVSAVDGGTIISQIHATPFNKTVASVVFPGQEGATGGGFVWSMTQTTDTCALLPCNFAWQFDDFPLEYDNPATEGILATFRCDATVCPGSGTNVTMFERDETGTQSVIFDCFVAGFVDPSPCRGNVQRLSGGEDQGDLQIEVFFLGGDPRVAGVCFGTC